MLAETTWTRAARGPATVLVPLGSTEQHGPHLPLSTDTLIAETWCHRVAARRSDVAVAPALPYGASGEHQDFPGTLSIGTEALTMVLVELGRSALGPPAQGLDRLVLVNGHGGNAEALTAAVTLLRSEGRRVDATWPRFGAEHAGRAETSLLLAVRPDLVDPMRAEAGNTTPMPELLPLLRADGIRAHAANGVLGDPTGADRDEGERLWRELERQLHDLLDERG